MKKTSFSAVFKAVAIVSAVGAAVFGGIFIAAGWSDGAYRIFVHAAVAAALNLAVYGFSAWLYSHANSRALNETVFGSEEFSDVLLPDETAYILPAALIALFSAVWLIAVFGFGEEFFDYFKDNFPGNILSDPSFAIFLLTLPAALISLICMICLSATHILYGDQAIEIKKPFGKPKKLFWEDIASVRFYYKNSRPEYLVFNCDGRKIKIARGRSNILKRWLPFGQYVIKTAKSRNIRLEVKDIK